VVGRYAGDLVAEVLEPNGVSGIAGIVSWGDSRAEAEPLASMLAAAPHRGRDSSGAWRAPGVALGHLCLWTTPESVHERQPLVDGAVVLVADARIDNRADLIRLLDLRESAARSVCTDADLIVAAYRRWGVDCAAKLVGDFAFAIWDEAERRLYAARDPMGMRALYYRVEPARALFATEIKQILAVAGVPVEIHEPAVAGHLMGGLGDPAWTMYSGIAQLPAAHALIATNDGHRTWRYWDIDPEHRIQYRTDAEYEEHFRDVFQEAVRARLRSIRSVGVLLSGGLDSGSIAAVAGWLLAHEPGVSVPDFRAYSWAFDELVECDERHISRGIAEHYGFAVTEVPVDDAWPLSTPPVVGLDRDDAFIFGHYAPLERTFAAAASEGMGLMLSGDRGDLVAGMGIYDLPSLLWQGRWRRLYTELGTIARVRQVPLQRVIRGRLLGPSLREAVPAGSLLQRLPGLRRLHAQAALPTVAWLPGRLAAFFEEHEHGAGSAGCRERLRGLARRQRYDAVFMPLHFHGLRTSERMHARLGQSFADPWSDRRLAEFAVAVPQRVLNRVGEMKRLTRGALRGLVPEPTRLAMSKIIPGPLFQRGILDRSRNSIAALLEGMESAARGYLDAGVLTDRYRGMLAGARDEPYLWHALTLELWLRTYWSQPGSSEMAGVNRRTMQRT
jgi:asparagine synthase (glutamine-hydrolysing)